MSQRSRYEIVLVVVVVILAMLLALGIYRGRVQVDAGRRLVQELATLRSGVALYRTVNKVYPSRLKVLLDESYAVAGGRSLPYLDPLARNEKGEIIDPFGNPYRYDAKSGWVSSVTRSYEHW